MVFDKQFKQVLLGSMCGDGHLSNGRKNSMYRESHSIVQKSYLDWKVNYFKKYFRIKLRYNIHRSSWKSLTKLNGKLIKKIYYSYSFDTNSNEQFGEYKNLFYPKGKGRKIISKKILEKINWLGIAVWYCDDGYYCYRNKSVVITFNEKFENVILSYFKRKGFLFKKSKQHTYYLTRKEGSENFLKNIYPYVIKMPKIMHDKIAINKDKIIESKQKIRKYRHLESTRIKDRQNKIRWEKQNKNHILKYRKKYYWKNRVLRREYKLNYYYSNAKGVISDGK